MTTFAHARKLAAERAHPSVNTREATRVQSLLDLIPEQGESVLDVGARNGYLASRLVGRYARIVALDLVKPQVPDPRVECVVGDALSLSYADASFETVVCSEVLEHIDPSKLEQACREIVRVARRTIVIGVPYRQDLRCGETLCGACGRFNPPWGHQNRFDEARLSDLFSDASPSALVHIGSNRSVTNAMATRLLRFAGCPYGTYLQDEPCVHCGAELGPPRQRTFAEKIATRLASALETLQRMATPARPSWIHARFDKAPLRQRPSV